MWLKIAAKVRAMCVGWEVWGVVCAVIFTGGQERACLFVLIHHPFSPPGGRVPHSLPPPPRPHATTPHATAPYTTYRLQQAKILERAGTNISRNATYSVGIMGVGVAVIILAFTLSGNRNLATAFGAVIYVVVTIIYFVAARKLQAVVGKGAASGKAIAGLSRRIAYSLALGIFSMLSFAIIERVYVPAWLPILGYIITIVLYFGLHGAFGIGHWFLLSFLNKALRSQGRKLSSARSMAMTSRSTTVDGRAVDGNTVQSSTSSTKRTLSRNAVHPT